MSSPQIEPCLVRGSICTPCCAPSGKQLSDHAATNSPSARVDRMLCYALVEEIRL